MRRFLIDTDTGNDDVWALIAALRAEEQIRVEAITVVVGNVPLDLCVKNALIAVEKADTYHPPVYKGMGRPIIRKMRDASNVHGEDGLSNMNLPYPNIKPEKKHAVDAIIDIIMENPGEIEVVTLGPLTNLAMAYLIEPEIAHKIKKVFIMGGTGLDQGNATPAAEFNIMVDAEAASIVLESGMDMTWVTWDTARFSAAMTRADFDFIASAGTPLSDFCVRCVQSVREYDEKKYKNPDEIGIIDSVIMIAAIWQEVMKDVYSAYCSIETKGEKTYGYFSIDKHAMHNEGVLTNICPAVDSKKYKDHLFKLFMG